MKSFGIALAGYILMFVVLFATLTAVYFALGTERTFLPGSYAVTPLWIAVFCFFQFDSGLVAGIVVSKLSRDRKVPLILAGMTLAFGILMALPAITSGVNATVARDGSLTNMEAMMQAQTPVWIQLIAPALAALGVTAGATLMSLVGQRRS
ncbi:hypothetical protein [Gemmatimonas groenlandica]|uniref:DUF4199 domain-containing protein n=1 Tax=Gemmatimonas groenlandica TaxID=2732249 RepID=A0A6M4IS16_9BACT|nr:hypothetical protein [Gemmatimonas groenlandica]QJR37420.1 hypothetical protein HKW67_18840 [Gemmatimonas groenlandica]